MIETEILKPHQRLKRVFSNHDLMMRLCRRFCKSDDYVNKWLREYEGENTGYPSPLQRVRDIIDEALIVDPSGNGARLIANDPADYLDSIMFGGEEAESINSFNEAQALIKEVNEAIQEMPESFDSASSGSLRDFDAQLVDVEQKIKRLRSNVTRRLTLERADTAFNDYDRKQVV